MYTYEHKIYFHDTDQAGVVHHSNYLKYCEAGRIELLNSLGFSYAEIQKNHIGLAPVDCQIQYKAPLRLDDTYRVETSLITLKKATVIFQQDIYKDSTLCFTATIKLACLNEAAYKVVPIPSAVYNALKTVLK
ncbi:tol-pal system-associated acyl-CoA thioesterase [Candidatus Marinamargulisbacteria bacterium SCGC AG-439-L15]|nr:tol-pal system-associated acyl-CoA thioesterase [Candidatus Marinamargulisbacteria bacterium SCGC AG-439-L15]